MGGYNTPDTMIVKVGHEIRRWEWRCKKFKPNMPQLGLSYKSIPLWKNWECGRR